MKELSLFTGMGGGIYGSLILGWQTVAYVEKDEYCQKVIKQRITDGWFDNGEIYGDIKEFNQKHAHQYAGEIDIITGGFPCQPFSVAGKRKGTSDDRYLFDEIIKTIKIVQPRQMLFENVPGLLTSSAIIEIYESLTRLGYIINPPLVLGSDDCGNIHRRKRVWIFAHAQSKRPRGRESQGCNDEWVKCQSCEQQRDEIWSETARRAIREFHTTNTTEQLRDGSECQSQKHTKQQESQLGNGYWQYDIADTQRGRWTEVLRGTTTSSEKPLSDNEAKAHYSHIGVQPANTNSERGERQWAQTLQRQSKLQRREDIRRIEDLLQRPDIPEPLLRRMDDELSPWKQRLKAVGNGQDPIVMATAYLLLRDLS